MSFRNHWSPFVFIPLALCYWVLLLLATHLSPGMLPKPGHRHIDKVQHVVAFAGLSVLMCAAAASVTNPRPNVYFAVVGSIAAYGILDELTQGAVPGRSASLFDWLADLGGAALGALIFATARPLLRRCVRQPANGAAARQ
jgi:VanZ family protein